MLNDNIAQYYDYLMHLAQLKCNNREEAEDLVSDTMLAAYSLLSQGRSIDYPKTWLTNVLYHKFNDNLRKKYHNPLIISLTDCNDMLYNEDIFDYSQEDIIKIRKEINYLGKITREAIIRYYYGNQNISEIASSLGISEGTVKSRVFLGRKQIKKGFEKMNTMENSLPGKLLLSFSGVEGINGEPVSVVDDDLIAQNLLILAYDKPLTSSELSRSIGIPTAYIEPIIGKLVDSELMMRTVNGKFYTDFFITKPQIILDNFNAQSIFTHKHFNAIWNIIEGMSNTISALSFVKAMGKEEKTKLDRYAVLRALQNFELYGNNRNKMPDYPRRKDGGRWVAQAIAIEGGYDEKKYYETASEYMIQGGHRITSSVVENGSRRVRLLEFDTTLFDNPHRYGINIQLYFKSIIPLLWDIYTNQSLSDDKEIPSEFLSYIPRFEECCGLLKKEDDKLKITIPVLKNADFKEIERIINLAVNELEDVIGTDFCDLISNMKTSVPKHLVSVPELFKYMDATRFFVMMVVREAYDKGLHLKNVDYCCPPVVLVYNE